MSTHVTKSIGRKILVGSLLIALPPLVFLAAAVLIGLQNLSSSATDRVAESRETLSEETVVLGSQDQAISIGREINLELRERVSDVAGWARAAEVVEAAKAAAAEADEIGLPNLTTEELEASFERVRVLDQFGSVGKYLDGELEANSDFGQVAFTDVNGFNVAATDRPDDFVQSDETWWQEAVASGLSLSDVEYDAASDVFSVDIAVRIDDPATDEMVGVIETSLSISFVQAITTERALENVDYTIALADGRLIADTSTEHAQIRMMSFSFAGGAASPGLGAALTADLLPGESATLITDDFIFGYTGTLAEEAFDIGVDGFNGFDWIVVSSQPTDIAFAPLDGLEALNDDISRSGRNLTLIAALIFLIGLVVATILARRLTRQIVDPVRALTDAASEAASSGLPTAVHLINEDGADVDDVAPPSVEIKSNDELQTLAGAFNSVQATALRLAAEQAKSRRNTTEMFVNLGRRNQSLLKRQLRFIDTLEENEQNPDTLESLFKLDHLATRMRRNAESLLVLAGDRSPRRWAKPIDVQSAVEAALAEVESYERVDFNAIGEGKIQGNIVADVAHILAEVIENGLNFSPPTAEVTVTGHKKGERYVVHVTDEGLGMKQDEIDRVNEQLATVIEITDVPSQQLGLFVVARLAGRHGIDVKLKNGPTGGLSVRIEMPLAEQPAEETKEANPAPGRSDAIDAAVEEADAEVRELLEKAEAAVAKAAEVRAGRSDEDIAEEAQRLADLRSNAELSSAAADLDETEAPEPIEATEAHVEVGDFSFPRRDAKAKPENAKEKPGSTVEPKSNATPKPKKRRKSDSSSVAPAADTNADGQTGDTAPADVEAFGFKRRESKRSGANGAGSKNEGSKKPADGRRKADQVSAADPSNGEAEGAAEDVVEVAEKSRSQWGSFQRGKTEAEQATPDDGDVADATAGTPGVPAAKKEQ